MEDHSYPVHHQLLSRCGDFLGWGKECGRADWHRSSKTTVHVPTGSRGQQGTELICCTAHHCRPGNNVFADGLTQEVFWCDDATLPSVHFFTRGNSEHSTEVVCVRMCINHSGHPTLFHVLIDQFQRRTSGEFSGQWVDDDPTLRTAYERDVRDVVSAHLPYTVDHVEQSMMRVQHRVSPQIGIYRVGCRISIAQKVIRTNVEYHSTRW